MLMIDGEILELVFRIFHCDLNIFDCLAGGVASLKLSKALE